MKLSLSLAANSLHSQTLTPLLSASLSSRTANSFPASSTPPPSLPRSSRPSRFVPVCLNRSNSGELANKQPPVLAADSISLSDEASRFNYNVAVGSPIYPSFLPLKGLGLGDQAFSLLAFIFCTTSVAFTSLVIAAVPTLHAMGRAAIALSKLADTAREELPSTMAAIRLSGMEISDLTLELSDLSQEITDGIQKSAQAVHAAEAGIRQIGSLACDQTVSMIQERANLPTISL